MQQAKSKRLAQNATGYALLGEQQEGYVEGLQPSCCVTLCKVGEFLNWLYVRLYPCAGQLFGGKAAKKKSKLFLALLRQGRCTCPNA